uniref:HAT C-terminal dimerisation domain-containing protein n=1 Tax=Rhizophagus irregularis (strain DAOM 181602 / DAOM 197198 / MUCL 43194) TaxID=747089 RepID=U9SMH4_RHIID
MDPCLKLQYYRNNKWEESFIQKAKKQKRKLNHDELSIYLNEKTISGKTDILAWWKVHEVKYLNLSKMACDYLSIPVTSAPIKQIFLGCTNLVVQK